MKILIWAFALLMISWHSPVYGKRDKVPGIVVDHLPASTKTFIGSPSLVILHNANFLTFHRIKNFRSLASKSR